MPSSTRGTTCPETRKKHNNISNAEYFRDGPIADLWREAAELATRYNWPEEAAQLRRHIIPPGFAREVGKAIVLFLEKPVISYAWIGIWTRDKEDAYNREMRAHGLTLIRLRVLLAKLRTSAS